MKEWAGDASRELDPIGGEAANKLMLDLMDFYSQYKDILAQ